MIPDTQFGIYDIDLPLEPIISKVFSGFQETSYLRKENEANTFISDLKLFPGKVFISTSSSLIHSDRIGKALKQALDIPTFHLILWDDCLKEMPSLTPNPRVHLIRAKQKEVGAVDDFIHHIYWIKASLEFMWLRTKVAETLLCYEEAYSTRIDGEHKTQRVELFIKALAGVLSTQSIQVFLLHSNGKEFYEGVGIGTPGFACVSRSSIEGLFSFNNTTETYLVTQSQFKEILPKESKRKKPLGSVVLSTFNLEGIPGFFLYMFESKYNDDLVWQACSISSREIFHLLRAKEINSRYDTLKALTEIKNSHLEKREVLWRVVSCLEKHFGADGVSILEVVNSEGATLHFHKTFIHVQREDQDSFPTDNGYAHYCVTNKKALLLPENFPDEDPPYGIAQEFDPDLNSLDKPKEGKRIDAIVAPNTIENEKSLMYFPLIEEGKVIGVIKVGDFDRFNAFTLHQFKALSVFADPIATLLKNIRSVANLKEEIDKRTFQEGLATQAEALFFYREIAIGIFHQVANYVNTIDSNLLMIEFLSSTKGEKESEINEYIKASRKHVKSAKEMINNAQKRGKTLKPIGKSCLLIESVVRPAIEYAKKRVEGSEIHINHTVRNDEFLIYLDADLAKESLINIINNAIWAVRANTKLGKKEIFIGVREIPEEHSVKIEISDKVWV